MTLPPHGPPEITEAQQAATSLGEVEDPTPDNVSRALQDYSPYAVAAAAASIGASGGGGGGSQTVKCVRFPIEFDTPGLAPESFPIIAVDPGVYPITSLVLGDSGDGSFTVAGNHTAAFSVGSVFAVTGSTGNDGSYTVESASFAAGHTTVTVSEFFYDPTPDGSLVAGPTITVAGDRTAAFAVGVFFTIVGSTGNNGGVTVSSVALADGGTVIGGTFPSDPLDPTPDGNAVVAVGAVVYTPTVGDILLGGNASPITLVSVGEAWNGTTPTIKVLTEAVRQAQSSGFVNLDATVADDPYGTSLMLSASPGFTMGAQWRLWRFTTADPIIVTVDDGSGLDPGSTQGAAEIVLLNLAAA